ncbi:hypothetical protein I7I53_01295 [Histoplasma capsulatum var. duboisii H88]|uniref:Uncharacterized protein n=1 Tax=Ajellomyces capsulatus (strain H88) TaxID=544711 RepID=A0A8A1LN76_AJEC8|nr:hypothetical protein I7I53_01295 [Histoplasma capsulatum var. duboisii H88]
MVSIDCKRYQQDVGPPVSDAGVCHVEPRNLVTLLPPNHVSISRGLAGQGVNCSSASAWRFTPVAYFIPLRSRAESYAASVQTPSQSRVHLHNRTSDVRQGA